MKSVTWPAAMPAPEALDLGPLVKGREYCRKVRDMMWRVRAEQMAESPAPCRRFLWTAFHAAARAEDAFGEASDRLARRWSADGVRQQALVLKAECMEILEQAIILEREIRNGATDWMEPPGNWAAPSSGPAPAA